MKLETVALAALVSRSVTASSCGPETEASVFYFNTENAKAQTVPQVNLAQGQMILSDFTGTSSLYQVDSAEDARLVASLKSTGLFSKNRLSETIVIAVDNLIDEDNLQCSHDLGELPAFNIKNFSTNTVSSIVETMVEDIEAISGRIAQSWKAGISVFTHSSSNNYKRMVDEYYNKIIKDESSVQEDINSIRTISKHTNGESIVLHLTSLKNVSPKDFARSRKDILDAVKELAAKQKNVRIALVATPSNSCDVESSKGLQKKVKISSFHGGLTKRSEGSPSILSTASTFATLEDCQNLTNSCSGHGKCKKTAMGAFECVCGKTYDETKKRSTQWGGNACQKKDVSTETQLFLWTGVVFLLILVGSLQLLFSIGNDPLPGVLSVSSKRA